MAAREAALGRGGILPGSDLAFVFSSLRANDLIWPYVVNNYLMGGEPAAFDLLYWNADSTNLPGPMYCYYLRNTYLENRLREPGALDNCGVPVDLGKVTLPIFVLATREDHIVPWRSAYRTLALAGRKRKAVRAGRERPHRRCGQSGGEEAAQPLGRRRLSGRIRRTGCPKRRSTRGAGGRAGRIGWRNRGGGKRKAPAQPGNCEVPADRAGARPLREAPHSLGGSMEEIYIVGAARTPIGKFGGSLAKTPASDLGALIIRKVLERARVAPEQVSEVIMGQVLTAGVGQNPARQAAIKAGLPEMIPSMTINKVCGSGLKAAMLGAQAIAHGDSDIVVAGGQESMSLSPHALMGSRDGFRMGDAKMVDTMIVDGLWDVFNQYHMGVTAENVAKEYAVTREEQDEFAVKSQNKTEAAQKAGRFKDEIVTVEIPSRKGPVMFADDEYPRHGATLEAMKALQARVRQERHA